MNSWVQCGAITEMCLPSGADDAGLYCSSEGFAQVSNIDFNGIVPIVIGIWVTKSNPIPEGSTRNSILNITEDWLRW